MVYRVFFVEWFFRNNDPVVTSTLVSTGWQSNNRDKVVWNLQLIPYFVTGVQRALTIFLAHLNMARTSIKFVRQEFPQSVSFRFGNALQICLLFLLWGLITVRTLVYV